MGLCKLQTEFFKLKSIYSLHIKYPNFEKKLNIKRIKDLKVLDSKKPNKKYMYLLVTDFNACLVEDHPFRDTSLSNKFRLPKKINPRDLGYLYDENSNLFLRRVSLVYITDLHVCIMFSPVRYDYYLKPSEFNISWFLFYDPSRRSV